MSVLPWAGAGRRATIEDALAHADALHDYAYHLAHHAADAEDLVQETFARAAGAWSSSPERARLAPWLFRILRNAFLDRRRRDRHLADEPVPETAEEPDGWLRGDLELERMRGLVAHEIEAALHGLAEEARSAVLLDAQGFTESEVAEVLGCAVGTVKSRLSRARAALRQTLAEYAREGSAP